MSIQLIQSPKLKSLLRKKKSLLRENIKSERENFAFEQLSSIFLKYINKHLDREDRMLI